MNAPTYIHPPRPISTRGFRPLMLAPQTNSELWTRLGECDRTIAALMIEQNGHATRSGYYAVVSAELDAWRDEQARVETELKARFKSHFVPDLAAFAERLS